MISPEHLAVLAASGIPEEHAEARGYETITDPSRLAQLKIVKAARHCVPGLLIPLLDIRGATWGYQYRPDSPRLLDGRQVKYETPYGQRNGIDIPPGADIRDALGDPTVSLWITEGTKKADCGAQYQLCIVALSGVWNFRGTNAMGGKTALADWNDIALNGREVVIAYDGDAARNPKVAKAVCALADFLKLRGATVKYLHLPDTGVKTGLDDYLVAGHDKNDLWRLVKPHQPPLSQQQQPAPVAPPPPPPHGSIDGAELLDDVRAYLRSYIVYPSGHACTAHTLWIAHTHLMDCWESTPRISFLSPEPSSGKTRALEVTEPLVPRPVHAINATPAYLFRKVSDPAGTPTILYDEVDTLFGPKAKDNEEIRGVLNAGHRKGAVAGRCVTRGDKIVTEELPAYCAVAMAGLDDLPDTIMTRSVIVRMKPRDHTETVRPWRLRIDMPIGRKLGERLEQWADSVRAHVKTCYPQIPSGVEDRDADVWEPLLAVAEEAGGHWPDTARVEAVEAVEDSKRKVPTMGVLLLGDIRKVFEDKLETEPDSYLLTNDLLLGLTNLSESPWSTIKRDGKALDARGLSQRLSRYGISSGDIKVHGAGLRGYHRNVFEDAWRRYLPSLPPTGGVSRKSSTASTASTDNGAATTLKIRNFFSVRGDPSTNGQGEYNGVGPPTGPGRCPDCHWHVPTMGHKQNCPHANEGATP